MKIKKLSFSKMVASGNDFVVIDSSHQFRRRRTSLRLAPVTSSAGGGPAYGWHKSLAKEICHRKFGIGADGLLVLEKSRVADIKMRIFNPDGSEAEMCGNGARCVGLFRSQVTGSAKNIGGPATSCGGHKSQVKIETRAGIIFSEVKGENVKIKLTDPKNIKLAIPVKINNRTIRVNFINTGVPHTVVFVAGLKEIDVFNLGRRIRYHQRFKPAGANVNFIEILNNNSLKIRTYERGVEDETLACGTGSVASAIIAAGALGHWGPAAGGSAFGGTGAQNINIHTKSGEILKVYFNSNHNSISDVWLEGKAKIVFKGEIYV